MKSLMVLFSLIFVLMCAPVVVDGAVKPANNLGIVGWWPLNEGTSTIAHDISGYGNNGTLTNIANPSTVTSGWTNGKRGKAITFDGNNDYIVTSNALSFGTKTATVAFWAYLPAVTAFPADTAEILVELSPNFNSNDAFVVSFNDNSGIGGGALPVGNIKTSMHSAAGYSVYSTTVGYGGGWRYITVVLDRNQVASVDQTAIYIDGVLVSKSLQDVSFAAVHTTNFANNNLYIGARSGGAVSATTTIDDLRVYNRAISPSEVLALYRAGQVTRQTVSQSGLVGWWTFDEGTSTKATDFSGQGNHGLLSGTGGPTWIGGRRGKALNFAGQDTNNNQTVTITAGATNPELAILGDVTVSAWIRPSSSYFDTAQAVVRAGSGADLDYSLFYDPVNQRPYFHWYDGGFPSVSGTTNSAPLNQWSLVTIVRSGLTASFYVNGVFTNSVAVTAPTVAAAQIAIGRTNNVGVPQDFSGDIDDVRVYNRALSASEVLDLYRQNQTEVGGSKETSVSDGLVGYWSFNGKDIDWARNKAWDRSGRNLHGSIVNMGTTTAPVVGRVGQALNFAGSNEYVEVSQPLTSSSPFTISMWYYPNAINGSYEILYSGTDNIDLQLFFHAGTKTLTTSIENNEISAGLTLNSSTINKWHHIVWTYDYSRRKVYINGVLAADTADATALTINDASVRFGKLLNSLVYTLQGRIDEIRVYNRALSDIEAKRLYNLGR